VYSFTSNKVREYPTSNHFFELDPKIQIDLLTTGQEQLNIPNIILEKDIWICWLLNEIFALSLQMAFKGGTSLSKVFNLINRFSEDVDITLDYRNFNTTLDLANLNRSTIVNNDIIQDSSFENQYLEFLNKMLKNVIL
jgi:predicted nucleotidyltransferase component of viral defense system